MFRRKMIVALAAGALAFGSVGASMSSAQADPLAEVAGEKLDITADRLQVDIDGGTALLAGNVKAVLGELTVTSPKVEIRYDEAPRVKWAKGSGGVRATLKGIVATSTSVELDVASRKVDLVGNVRLSRGKGWVTANKASIDLETRKVTLHRVEGSIPVKPPKR